MCLPGRLGLAILSAAWRRTRMVVTTWSGEHNTTRLLWTPKSFMPVGKTVVTQTPKTACSLTWSSASFVA
jgi:hypothetical protein